MRPFQSHHPRGMLLDLNHGPWQPWGSSFSAYEPLCTTCSTLYYLVVPVWASDRGDVRHWHFVRPAFFASQKALHLKFQESGRRRPFS